MPTAKTERYAFRTDYDYYEQEDIVLYCRDCSGPGVPAWRSSVWTVSSYSDLSDMLSAIAGHEESEHREETTEHPAG